MFISGPPRVIQGAHPGVQPPQPNHPVLSIELRGSLEPNSPLHPLPHCVREKDRQGCQM